MFALLLEWKKDEIDEHENCLSQIDEMLESYHFSKISDTLYWGYKGLNAVDCCVALADLTRKLPWFNGIVQRVEILRIESQEDATSLIRKEAQWIEKYQK